MICRYTNYSSGWWDIPWFPGVHNKGYREYIHSVHSCQVRTIYHRKRSAQRTQSSSEGKKSNLPNLVAEYFNNKHLFANHTASPHVLLPSFSFLPIEQVLAYRNVSAYYLLPEPYQPICVRATSAKRRGRGLPWRGFRCWRSTAEADKDIWGCTKDQEAAAWYMRGRSLSGTTG